MPTLSHEQTLLIGAVVGPVLFAASVFITGARRRHIGAAALAAVAYGLATYCWDRLAAVAGWWYYPFDPTATGPVLALDLLAGVVAGGAFGLVGARLTASYGRLGLAAFLLAWTAWGVLHDLAGSALFAGSNLMTFTNGPVPPLADAVNYATCGALAQLVIRLVAGPPAAASWGPSRLRRPSRKRTPGRPG